MKKIFVILQLILFSFFFFSFCQAAIEKYQCEIKPGFLNCGGPLTIECKNSCDLEDLKELICNLINFVANCLAQIALIFGISFGGFNIMFAAGDPEKIEAGKKAIAGSIIGYAIVLLASSLISLILNL